MGTGEDSVEQASTPKVGRKQPPSSDVSARIGAMEKRLAELTTRLDDAQIVITAQQLQLKEMANERGTAVDSRSTLLLGAMWNLAQDPFNSGAWDKFRQFLRAAQRA